MQAIDLIAQHSDSIALAISLLLYTRVEQLQRKVSRICGKIDVVLTVLRDKNGKNAK